MKRFDSGEALAKEMGISPTHLKKTFETYNTGAKAKKDPFGKKVFQFLGLVCVRKLTRAQFFASGDWTMDDYFHVAVMTPVLHYTMGGLEVDAESRVVGKDGKLRSLCRW